MAPISFFATFSLLVAAVAAVPPPFGFRVGGVSPNQFTTVPIKNTEAKNIIPNKYIVVYNNTFDDEIINAHEAHWVGVMKKRNLGKRSSIDNRFFSTEVHTFSIGTMRAMALDAEDVDAIEINNADCVSYLEADAYISINTLVTQTNATTGLARLSSTATGNTDYVFDDSAGEDITAFVVDTGIMTNHTEFENRATLGFNAVNNVDTDENGHGSHVAGTIGGKTFGVAKKVTLIGVKVLDANGAGTNSGVISGMNFGMSLCSSLIRLKAWQN